MYSVADGDTILVDRNCHKSVTYLMMMLDVKKLHFDNACIPYAIFHPIYKHKSAMQIDPRPEHIIFKIQSPHKLLVAFS